MCWRWDVSLVFACVEWAAAGCMYLRNYGRDRKYSYFIASIASMESTQGALWLFALDDPSAHWLANVLLSIFIWLSAWVLIPLSMANFVDNVDSPIKNRKAMVVMYFLLQALFVLILQAVGGIWQTGIGAHHHQIWVCTQALQRFGAHFLRESQSYLFCPALCFLYVFMVAVAIYPLTPKYERDAFLGIGIITFSVMYYNFSATLEACSVWCWSAGGYLIFFLGRTLIPQETIQQHEEVSC